MSGNDDNEFEKLIERSSLGTRGARALRRRTPRSQVTALRLAEVLFEGGHVSEAIDLLRPYIEAGDRAAARQLGVLLARLANTTEGPQLPDPLAQFLRITEAYRLPSIKPVYEFEPEPVPPIRWIAEVVTPASPQVRFSLRVPILHFARSHALRSSLTLIRDPVSRLVLHYPRVRPDTARMILRNLEHALDLARELDVGGTSHDTINVLNDLIEHVRGIADGQVVDDEDLELIPVLERAIRLARATTRGLGINLIRHLTRSFGADVTDVLGEDLGWSETIEEQLTLRTDLQVLVRAVDNFVGADLRNVDLTGVPLEGMRWSATTRWPDEWVARIEDASVHLGGGVYEIRPGTTDVREPSLTS